MNSIPRKAVRLVGEIGLLGRELVERAALRIRTRGYPSRSWYWSILEEYRDAQGRTIEQSETAWISAADTRFISTAEKENFLGTDRWMMSPRPAQAVDHVVHIIESFFDVDEPFTYLEFGACFGTTIAQVLGRFRNARGIAVEVVPARFDVVQWMIQKCDPAWNLVPRIDLHQRSITEVPLRPGSVDVVFMDTNHVFPDEYNYVMHLLNGGALKKGFLFIGDDPLHTGTDTTRRHFIEKHGDAFKVITRADQNLWWFFRTA